MAVAYVNRVSITERKYDDTTELNGGQQLQGNRYMCSHLALVVVMMVVREVLLYHFGLFRMPVNRILWFEVTHIKSNPNPQITQVDVFYVCLCYASASGELLGKERFVDCSGLINVHILLFWRRSNWDEWNRELRQSIDRANITNLIVWQFSSVRR